MAIEPHPPENEITDGAANITAALLALAVITALALVSILSGIAAGLAKLWRVVRRKKPMEDAISAAAAARTAAKEALKKLSTTQKRRS